jgi:hypothetical protein
MIRLALIPLAITGFTKVCFFPALSGAFLY